MSYEQDAKGYLIPLLNRNIALFSPSVLKGRGKTSLQENTVALRWREQLLLGI